VLSAQRAFLPNARPSLKHAGLENLSRWPICLPKTIKMAHLFLFEPEYCFALKLLIVSRQNFEITIIPHTLDVQNGQIAGLETLCLKRYVLCLMLSFVRCRALVFSRQRLI
jgi:hypothetical protein